MENKYQTAEGSSGIVYVDKHKEIAKVLFNQLSTYELSISEIEVILRELDMFIEHRSKVRLEAFE